MTDSISVLNLEAGQVVGGYTLVSRLGGGAMGTVWTVRDAAGQIFAMKILRDSLSEESSNTASAEYREHLTARERLRREALALSRVRHPGVAAIVDMELDDTLAFIVTELIDGDNLREDVSQNGPYLGEDLELLTEKLSSAVEAVHAAGIIHRDIKPTNVMISATGPVLVDFGIAMGAGESHVTRTGLVMGTPGFIAPEVIEGSESDEATDWWSVTSVLAFAATGKPVFGSKPIMAVLERAASGNADLSGLPQRTADAFRSALSPHRANRITHQELLQVIRHDVLNPGAGVVRPFDSGAHVTSLRSHWTHAPAEAAARDTLLTQVLFGADAQGTRALETDDSTQSLNRGSTRVMPQTPPGTTQNGLENLRKLQQPVPLEGTYDFATTNADTRDPQATTIVASPAVPQSPISSDEPQTQRFTNDQLRHQQPTGDEDFFEFADAYGPPNGYEAPQSYSASSDYDAQPAPVVIPAPLMVQQQIRSRVGTGRTLTLLIAIPLALMCAWLPTGGALLALVLTWLASARGYSLQSQVLRESKRGGTRKRLDGALNVISAPWHLLHAALAIIPKLLLWMLFYVLVNLLMTNLTEIPTVTSGITLFSRTFNFSLIAGAPLSTGGISLALTALAAWFTTTSLGAAPSPSAIGFASAWSAIIHGASTVKNPGEASNEAATESSALEPDSSSPSRRGVCGTLLLIALIAFTIAAITMFFVATSVDWSPILTW